MEINETLYAERNAIQRRIVDCQKRYASGERGTEIENEYNAAASESRAFDTAHPEIKQVVIRQLREYHNKRQPFISKIT